MDGAASAAVVRHKYPGAELLPAKHGDPVPAGLAGKRVFIVDFSYGADLLKKLKAEAAELHWFDHHKTALSIRDEVGFGVLDMNESGATLTWKQLFPGTAVPKILQYVRDKDIWLWELPDSREVSAALSETEGILDPSVETWPRLLKGMPAEEWTALIERGAHSRRLLKQNLEKAVKKGFVVEIDGLQGFAVNWTDNSSDLGEYIYKALGHSFALIFSYNGKEWTYSLRSDKVDVSEIAAQFGGGGHAGAAGFRTQDLDWLLLAKKKKS